MKLETLHAIYGWTALLCILGISAWLIFFPPRGIRAWPSIVRPLLAIVCVQALLFAAYRGYLNPAADALVDVMEAAEPEGTVMFDARLHHLPQDFLPSSIVYSSAFYLIRLGYLSIRRWMRLDAAFSPTAH